MKKKAQKATAKSKKASTKKPVAKNKPAKAKKAKPAKKKTAPTAKKTKPVAKKPVQKKTIVKKTAPKVVAKKAVKPVAKPAPVKTAPRPQPSVTAKPAVKKLTPAEISKLGLKPLPKPLPSQVKEEKKAKGYYTLEYIINSSPDVLFDFVSTAGGLEKWFAEKVSVKENVFHFYWENDETKEARLIALKEREFARFHWLDQADSKKYFEFRIQIDDLTSEVALIVSDFADTKEDFEDSRLLWNAQIHDLLHALGGAP